MYWLLLQIYPVLLLTGFVLQGHKCEHVFTNLTVQKTDSVFLKMNKNSEY